MGRALDDGTMKTGYLIVGALIFALAAAGVLVWTNLLKLPFGPSQPSESTLVVQMTERASANGVVAAFTQADVKRWQIAAGHRLERFSADDGKTVIARLTSTSPIDYASFDWPKSGLSIQLPLEFAAAANGKRLEIGFIARMPGANASEEIAVIYATQQVGNSTWQHVKLSSSFAMYKFTYDVPAVSTGYSKEPILVFHSDATGGGKAVELLGAFVKVLP